MKQDVSDNALTSTADTAAKFSILPPQKARRKKVQFNLPPSLYKKRQRSSRSLNGKKSFEDYDYDYDQPRWEPFLQYASMTCQQKIKEQPHMPIRRKSADKPAQIVLPSRRSSVWTAAARNNSSKRTTAQVLHSSDQPLNMPMRKSSLLCNASNSYDYGDDNDDNNDKDIFPSNIQQIMTELNMLDRDVSSSEFDLSDPQLDFPLHPRRVSVNHTNNKNNKSLFLPMQKMRVTDMKSSSRKEEMDIKTAIDKVTGMSDLESLEMVDSSNSSEATCTGSAPADPVL